jgi:hypothetical protein
LTTDGTLLSLDRLDRTQLEEIFAFKVNGKAPGAPGQHRNMAFVGSDDYNLYAINMYSGRLSWRYVAGAPILRGASANDYDVFVTPERSGLRRVDRVSGREAWINRDTERFLAANQYYIYGLDRFGKMNVIDGRRGTTLATHDLSDWAIAVPNEWTDRIYLAANDGQVLCMRHRENVKAVAMKTFEQPKAKEVKKAEPKKEEEKKEEEKKEEKKDDKDKAARLGRAPAAVDAEIRAARPREQNDPQIDALPMDQRLRARR